MLAVETAPRPEAGRWQRLTHDRHRQLLAVEGAGSYREHTRALSPASIVRFSEAQRMAEEVRQRALPAPRGGPCQGVSAGS